MGNSAFERRRFIKSSAISILGITAFGSATANSILPGSIITNFEDPLFYRYPAVNDEITRGIVGASHANIDRVKELLNKRPELACAAWDWGFGDYETALGAASHVGRRDIAELLISHGARPDIFTIAMMGMLNAVKELVEHIPGIQSRTGPHGITLLQHAKNRLEDKNINEADKANVNKVISYLAGQGNADIKPLNIEMTDEEKQRYLGEYKFGNGAGESFVVDMNSRKWLQIGRKGSSGIRMRNVAEHTFSPPASSSVKIIFKMEAHKAASLSIHEPEPLLTATRI
jgi:hypothetical protein